MAKYRWDKDTQKVYEVTPATEQAYDQFVSPAVAKPFEEYLSPVTNERISGRREQAKDLARHNCVDYRELPSQERMNREKNARAQQSYERTFDDTVRELSNR